MDRTDDDAATITNACYTDSGGTIVPVCDSCDCPACRSSGWTPWTEGFGVGARVGGNGNASGLNYSVGGTTFGFEKDLDDCTVFGAVGGYSHSYVLLDQRADHGLIDSGQAGLYLHRTDDTGGFLTGIAAYGYNAYDTRRHVIIGSDLRAANAGYGGNDYSVYLETGRDFGSGNLHLQPYSALQFIQLEQNGFVESGANSVDLSVGGLRADSFRGLLGTRLLGYHQTHAGRLLSFEGRALWRHEFLDEGRILDATLAGQPGSGFVINGLNVDRDAAILGSGVTLYSARGARLFANYDLQISQNYTAHAASGGLMFVR
jgi:uncharacterized protein with beta-barrel porin domain